MARHPGSGAHCGTVGMERTSSSAPCAAAPCSGESSSVWPGAEMTARRRARSAGAGAGGRYAQGGRGAVSCGYGTESSSGVCFARGCSLGSAVARDGAGAGAEAGQEEVRRGRGRRAESAHRCRRAQRPVPILLLLPAQPRGQVSKSRERCTHRRLEGENLGFAHLAGRARGLGFRRLLLRAAGDGIGQALEGLVQERRREARCLLLSFSPRGRSGQRSRVLGCCAHLSEFGLGSGALARALRRKRRVSGREGGGGGASRGGGAETNTGRGAGRTSSLCRGAPRVQRVDAAIPGYAGETTARALP